jgi:hypothetical protein
MIEILSRSIIKPNLKNLLELVSSELIDIQLGNPLTGFGASCQGLRGVQVAA